MLKVKRVTVDGVEYEMTQLGALEGRKLWLRLLKTLSAGINSLASFKSASQEAMLTALANVVHELDDETVELMCKAFGKRCRFENEGKWPELDPLFDMHFAGRYLSMSKWIGECVIFNFADFLGEASLSSLFASVTAGMSKPKSPTTSTGSSGGS